MCIYGLTNIHTYIHAYIHTHIIPFGITLSKMGDPGIPLNHFLKTKFSDVFFQGVGLSFYSDPRGAGGFWFYNIKFHFIAIPLLAWHSCMGVGCSHSIESGGFRKSFLLGVGSLHFIVIMGCSCIAQSSRAVSCYSMDGNGNLGECSQARET